MNKERRVNRDDLSSYIPTEYLQFIDELDDASYTGDGYWAYLHDGYVSSDTKYGVIHASSLGVFLERLKRIEKEEEDDDYDYDEGEE